MLRALAVIELILAGALLSFAAIFFANAKLCWFNQASCGMIEPLLAAFATAIAISVGLAGALHWRGKGLVGSLALVPALAVVVFLIGQARLWW